ncbi:MAG: MBL fold metallo-hydrolase [Phocaeicola sp.]
MKKLVLLVAMALSVITAVAQKSSSNQSSIQLIRNATLRINYCGETILVDPMFAPKGAIGSIRGAEVSPMYDLRLSPETIVQDLDLVLVTHNHPDHYDAVAGSYLSRDVKLMHQPADSLFFQQEGYRHAESVDVATVWRGITITRTYAQHGTGRMLKEMGQASGFVLQAPNEPTIYIVGDGVWTEEIYQTIDRFKPDYIVVNSGGARFLNFDATPIIMDEEQTMALIQESGDAKVIAVHMDVIDHCLTTRAKLKEKAAECKVDGDKLLIPMDGEVIKL